MLVTHFTKNISRLNRTNSAFSMNARSLFCACFAPQRPTRRMDRNRLIFLLFTNILQWKRRGELSRNATKNRLFVFSFTRMNLTISTFRLFPYCRDPVGVSVILWMWHETKAINYPFPIRCKVFHYPGFSASTYSALHPQSIWLIIYRPTNHFPNFEDRRPNSRAID